MKTQTSERTDSESDSDSHSSDDENNYSPHETSHSSSEDELGAQSVPSDDDGKELNVRLFFYLILICFFLILNFLDNILMCKLYNFSF